MRMLGVVVAGVVLLVSAEAAAQQCGDADQSGTVTVTDGVRALRRAGGLPPGCDPRRCDLDGSGVVTLTDGVNVLRLAAGLAVSALSCPTPDLSEFADEVESADGTDADLDVGVAPLPGQAAPDTVSGVEGNTNATPGGESTFAVSYDAGAAATDATIAAGEPELLIAVRKPNREFARGFFRLPLPSGSGEVGVTIRFPNQLPSQTFFLAFATRQNGAIGQYQFFAIRPGGTNPTPTATPTGPVCGNSKVEAGETCDPPGSTPVAGNPNVLCQQSCTYCGDLIKNGAEFCDGPNDPLCEVGCLSDCSACFPVPR
jgi:hypothetical protein